MTSRPTPAASLLLMRAALLLFSITVVIGLLNGLDLVEFGHDTLLTHVHAGTLGWITLSVIGATIWLFGADEVDPGRTLAIGATVAITIYVGTFWLGNRDLRPVAGTLAFIAIAATLVWALRRRAGAMRDLPRFAMSLALVSLTFGAVLGVLLGLVTAGRATWLPTTIAAAHPPTMVIGYLILAGMAIVEWRMAPPDSRDRVPRLGVAQALLLFAAGIALVLGLILDIFPLLVLNAPLEFAGVVIFLVRLRRPLLAAGWGVAGSRRAYAASAIFLTINIGLLIYLIANYADTPDAIPTNLILALDHIMFVGVMTNALLGLVGDAAGERRLSGGLDHAVFVGMNVGLVVFAVGLLAEQTTLKRIGAPLIGTAILVAIVVYTISLSAGRRADPSSPSPRSSG